MGRVVAELEVNLLLAAIHDEILVYIDIAIAITIGAGLVIIGTVSSAELVDLDKTLDQPVSGINIQHTIGAGPVLDAAVDFILFFLGAGGNSEEYNSD